MMQALNASLTVLSALTLFGWVYLTVRLIRGEKRSIPLPKYDGAKTRCLVSVIIPARNEEKRVGACLESILKQRGAWFEVILVDDGSTDSTGEIVLREYVERGVVYLRPAPKPSGWQGKSWACWNGFKHSRGEWLLFVDADTEFLDEALLRDAVVHAERTGTDALSLVPRLRMDTLTSKVFIPMLLNLLYVLTPPSRTNDPKDKLAFFFGAFILVRRRVYESVGGHEAVKEHILEDKALGELIKGSGYRTALMNAEERLSAVFNETLTEYYNAMLRLFGEYAVTSGHRPLVNYALGAFAFFSLPTLLAVVSLALGLSVPSAISLTTLAVMCSTHAYRSVRNKVRPWAALLFAIPGWVVFAALVGSICSARRGTIKVAWRGREYLLRAPPS